MKPLIGVLPIWDDKKESLWMLPDYFKGLTDAGAIPVMLPILENMDDVRQLAHSVDGLLFTGGHDIEPARYGEKTQAACGDLCKPRDAMEIGLFQEAAAIDLPMFGTCRGLQLFNVAAGGTLYQDIPSEYERPSDYNHNQEPPYQQPCHPVQILHNTPLHALLKTDRLAVNSIHHQAVRELSAEFTAMAHCDDGIIEAIAMPSKTFVWAVQWHPEFMLDTEHGQKLFQAFVGACKEKRNKMLHS